MRPASDGERLYAASHDGDVLALDPKNGRTVWRAATKLPLAGGPGAGSGRVIAGSSEGDVIALNAADGKAGLEGPRQRRVLAAPAVGSDIVVIRTVDGRLVGLNLADGQERWNTEQQVPRLSLRGTAAPVIIGDVVVCGFDNGKVVSVSLADGGVQWETQVASSKWRTELARLVDIDSMVQPVDKDLYVVGFQAVQSCWRWTRTDLVVTRFESSDRGLVVDAERSDITDARW